MDDITQKEKEDVARGAQQAASFMRILQLAIKKPTVRHPHIRAMQCMSPEHLTDSEINEIKEGSAQDSIMSMADITTHHMEKAREAMSDDAYQHVLNAIENALMFAVHITNFNAEEMAYLSDKVTTEHGKEVIRESASRAGKASKRPYVKEKEKVLARYHELMKLDNFKTASRAALSRKIAKLDGLTVNERTINSWLKNEIEREK